VAQSAADHLDVDAGRQSEARVDVPQVVRAVARDASAADELSEQVRDGVRAKEATVLLGEN
jgi:hypothetical protein